MISSQDRRHFMTGGAALLGAAQWPRLARGADGEGALETRRIVLNPYPIACVAPVFVAEAFLKAEGFEDVVFRLDKSPIAVGPGKIDLDLPSVSTIMTHLDDGAQISVLGTIHLGCYELFAKPGIQTIRDLKGKTIPVSGLRNAQHALLSVMMAYVGMNPQRDINWVEVRPREGVEWMKRGAADAYLSFPPDGDLLRAAGHSNVIVNTAVDRPWSHYGCCLLTSYPDFIEANPVATRRAMRALLKAADYCATNPERTARVLTEKGVVKDQAIALSSLRELRFDVWRTHDPEDAMRFVGNRLYDVGMIHNTPTRLIERSVRKTHLTALRRELKA